MGWGHEAGQKVRKERGGSRDEQKQGCRRNLILYVSVGGALNSSTRICMCKDRDVSIECDLWGFPIGSQGATTSFRAAISTIAAYDVPSGEYFSVAKPGVGPGERERAWEVVAETLRAGVDGERRGG